MLVIMNLEVNMVQQKISSIEQSLTENGTTHLYTDSARKVDCWHSKRRR